MAALGLATVAVGAMLIYAAFTGESLVAALEQVLSGEGAAAPTKPVPAVPGAPGAANPQPPAAA